MMDHPRELEPLRREHLQKGDGGGFARNVIALDALKGSSRFRMVSHITLDPGASVGPHQHVEDEEVYCILSGTGEYLEEDTWRPVEAGHITVALKGGTHGLRNTGSEPLEFLAVIAQ